MPTHNGRIEITQATDEFIKEIERLNREEDTRKKYKLTLSRLATWCAAQNPQSAAFLFDAGRFGDQRQ
jgi:hypothetical protein